MEDFDKNIENIKNKMNKITFSDEKKEKLKKKLEEELNKTEIDETKKKRKFFIPKQIAVGFAACVFLTTGVFAEQIGDFVDNIFCNTYQGVEEAIANGDVQTIEMDYVEHDGVSIKVDYVIRQKDSLIIAFNVLSEEEFDKVFFDEFEIRNTNNVYIHNSRIENFEEVKIKYEFKRQNKKNIIMCLELRDFEKYLNENNIKWVIKSITFENENGIKYINNRWNFEIYMK